MTPKEALAEYWNQKAKTAAIRTEIRNTKERLAGLRKMLLKQQKAQTLAGQDYATAKYIEYEMGH